MEEVDDQTNNKPDALEEIEEEENSKSGTNEIIIAFIIIILILMTLVVGLYMARAKIATLLAPKEDLKPLPL